jgi:hypothetical protein
MVIHCSTLQTFFINIFSLSHSPSSSLPVLMPFFPSPLSVTTAALLSYVPSNDVVLTQDLADELVLVDTKPDKLRDEMLNLQHSVAFHPHTKIHTSVDYAVTVGSDLCIVTAIGIPSILLGPNTQRNETGWGWGRPESERGK